MLDLLGAMVHSMVSSDYATFAASQAAALSEAALQGDSRTLHGILRQIQP